MEKWYHGLFSSNKFFFILFILLVCIMFEVGVWTDPTPADIPTSTEITE